MHKIAILLGPTVATFELGCASELFALSRPEYPDWYQTDLISFHPGPLTATGGLQLLVPQVQDLTPYDTILIPNWSVSEPEPPEELRAQLLAAYQRGVRLISFCSGAFLLAELGVLRGKAATTHWRYADEFQRRYPDSRYQQNVLYCFDGQIGCSAGSAAALDLGLAVIRRDFGFEIANQVAKRAVISAHREGGQAQFVALPLQKKTNLLSATMDWALLNLNKPLAIEQLADKAGMSRRSFDRHFKASTGVSPLQWLLQQRLQLVQHYLEQGQHSIEQISDLTGFGSSLNLRQQFQKQLGISPRQYQRQFSCSQLS
ncbi:MULTISPECIES: helix-turn-helix domain-containing protein [Rheinheimera]|jgi:AraC family transcriptional regulator, transcriptional activator FtrA|uniref:helix-turn-helix domain-containing protein n=1 Tax=Rheinheimera TaxID=67575 RepID=UPI001E499CFF|nr:MULTISPECIES: helix-turn-helix domain-containing protein [Rheinheimera]HJS14365.1 helix-turn-helix domain-containing protein [Rheinheimera sp.]